MKGRWYSSERDDFLSGVNFIFRNVPQVSLKSKASIEREGRVDTLIKRVVPQIKEYQENNLPWKTPEDWDRSFYILGGGPSRRKSDKILSRCSWENFLRILKNLYNLD